MTTEMFESIIVELKKAAENPEVKFLAFTGSGEYYSSGNDLSKAVWDSISFYFFSFIKN